MLHVSEIFLSIQGESTYVGIPCVFVRLAGCNLKCRWCDTTYAREIKDAREMTIEEVVKEVRSFKAWLAEVTGGEPLLQEETPGLITRLLDEKYTVLIETNGSVSLEDLDKRVIKVVDVKCPSSGACGSFLMENLDHITEDDEIKFVVEDRADYEFAKKFVEDYIQDRTTKVLFAPVRPVLEPSRLAEWILMDGLKVRLQVQMHTYIWKKGEKSPSH